MSLLRFLPSYRRLPALRQGLGVLLASGLGLGLPAASDAGTIVVHNTYYNHYNNAYAVSVGAGGIYSGGYSSINIGAYTPNDTIYLSYPFAEGSATISLPTLPESGILELSAAQTQGIPVTITGLHTRDAAGSTLVHPHPNHPPVTYQWTEDHLWSPAQPTAYVGAFFLRWFWNDQPVGDISAWLADGSNGKWGTYRVELWQSKVIHGSIAFDPSRETLVRLPSGKYEFSHRAASQTFQVTLQGQTALAPGTPPLFEEEPDLPATVLLQGPSLTLTTRANAGDPFLYRWYKNDTVIHSGPSLTLTASQVDAYGARYRCEVSNSQGTDSTATWTVRKPHRPLADLRGSTPLVNEGGMLVLAPSVQSDSGATCVWTGPALSANDGRATVLENGHLEIRNARLIDSGEYHLTVSDAEGSSEYDVRALVVRLPSGAHPLAAGQTVTVAVPTQRALSNSHFEVDWYPPAEALKDCMASREVFTCLRASPLLLSSIQVVACARPALPYDILYPNAVLTVRSDAEFRVRSTFSLKMPTQPPVMPEHSLPAGQVGRLYSAPGPGFVTAANGATRYGVSGLPRGLKATPQGAIEGYPTQSGDFTLRFTASNAKGRAAPVSVSLHIAPLPPGVAGEWVFSKPEVAANASRALRVTILPTGAYSGKTGQAAVRGNVTVNDDGSTDVEFMRIPAGETNYASETSGQPSGALGWRNVWSKKTPVGHFAGRYNYQASAPQYPANSEVTPAFATVLARRTMARQGHTSGSVLVGTDGRTTTTHHSSDALSSLSSAFLGPQGEIHHIHSPNEASFHAFHLKVDGTCLSGEVPAPKQAYYQSGGQQQYSPSYVTPSPAAYNGSIYEWPYQLVNVYKGRRYTPPAPKALPAGFSTALTPNAQFNIQPNTALYRSTIPGDSQPAQLSPNGSVTLPSVYAITHPATCKVHLPTGAFSGTVRLLVDPAELFRAMPFQGFLVPQEDASTAGWGCLRPPPYWGAEHTLPVTLSPARESE